VRIDAHSWVVTGVKPVAGTDAVMVVRTKNHLALDAVLKGQATHQDLDVLIAAINMTEALTHLRIGMDWRAEIHEAHEALLTMCRRGVANGHRFVFTGPEMAAVKLAMEVHDAQLDRCTVLEMEQGLAIVQTAIITKKAIVINGVPA
jgi:hypothetical protein